jgi:hypothetical protein
MAAGSISNPNICLKRAFKNALVEPNEDEQKAVSKAKTPIYQIRRGLSEHVAPAQVRANRAVTHAAEALAALWKTSRSKVLNRK